MPHQQADIGHDGSVAAKAGYWRYRNREIVAVTKIVIDSSEQLIMKLGDRYKYECDRFRLLVEEFENQVNNYNKKNKQYINEIVVHDANEYLPPKYIPNYKLTLT
ncbi:MAG: hypothetical protein JSR71_05445 [Proteobacteria bacterium]|nr:hypothetical protein [Pseudomonadota bacterium]